MADVGKIDFFSAFTKFSETMKSENVFSLMGKGISGVIKGLGKLGAGILKFLISPMGLSLIAITAVIYVVNKLVKAF
jgi:hypothetical protein